MKVLLIGIVLFLVFFLFHLIMWKLHIPKNHIRTLLKILFFVLIIGTVFIKIFSIIPNNFLQYLHICIFFIFLVLAYVVTYSAVSADSPSLVIVMAIAKSGSKGLDKEELYNILNDNLLVKPRVKDLINSKMAYLDGNNYKLTTLGKRFVEIFIFYRKLLNLPKGG